MPLFLVAGVGVAAILGVIASYSLLPHVAERIDRFIDPASGDTFQVTTALRAFESGGIFGRGPGEGVIKDILPDAHSDFIFAVAGEEFGLLRGLAVERECEVRGSPTDRRLRADEAVVITSYSIHYTKLYEDCPAPHW